MSRVPGFITWARCLLESDAGATMVEYGPMVGLIALVAVGAVLVFGQGVLGLFKSAVDRWP